MRRALLLIVALAVLALPSAAVAARCQQTTVVDLEDEVMCPVCGMTIGLAREAPQAKRERAFIQSLVASCRSKGQIKTALVDEFGPAVLAEPSHRGFSSSAYLVPLIAGAGMCAAVMLALLRWRRRTATDGTVPTVGDGERLLLEAELERLR
jgi:cytochrome c-type biogenesis protein CcmH/NrfF